MRLLFVISIILVFHFKIEAQISLQGKYAEILADSIVGYFDFNGNRFSQESYNSDGREFVGSGEFQITANALLLDFDYFFYGEESFIRNLTVNSDESGKWLIQLFESEEGAELLDGIAYFLKSGKIVGRIAKKLSDPFEFSINEFQDADSLRIITFGYDPIEIGLDSLKNRSVSLEAHMAPSYEPTHNELDTIKYKLQFLDEDTLLLSHSWRRQRKLIPIKD